MTKRNLTLAAVALACLPLAALVFVAGCETESVTQTDIQVRPAYSELVRGQSVTLSASGWSNYRWSLKDENIGYLSSRVGNSVTYTATSGSGSTQVITAAADASVTTKTTPTTTTTGDTDPTDGEDETPSTTTTTAPYSGTARVLHR